jgi:uncharacterized protein (TIGR04255 family)
MQNLLNFRNPPVDEVVLSIQFASLSKLKSAHIGLFWGRINHRFPDVSEQPAIPPAFETFGGIRTAPTPMIQLQALLAPPMPRYWFEYAGEADLLQLQQDRLLRNWRQAPDNSRVYPRYEPIREAFRKDMEEFQDWLHLEKLGEVVPNQCEVTYINIIRLPDGSNPHTQLHRISNVWSDKMVLPSSQTLEHSNVQLVSVFEYQGKLAGRTYITFQPAFTQVSSEPVVKLDITVRGKPLGDTVTAAFDFLDLARVQVVNTFASITTEEMHKFWERYDA